MIFLTGPVNLQQTPIKWNSFNKRKESMANSHREHSLLEDMSVLTSQVKTRVSCYLLHLRSVF